jgi:hypothetical protein
MSKTKFNLKENIPLQRKLLGEALVASKTKAYPNWKPKKPWSGSNANLETRVKTIGKPFPMAYGEEAAYEVALHNDFLWVWPNGNAYSTNFAKEYTYSTHKDYPNAVLVLFNPEEDNRIEGYITLAGGKPKWNLVQPEASEDEATQSDNPFLDGLQLVLDVIGFIPGIGDVVDLINAVISFLRGNKLDGFLSLIGAIPIVGSVIAVPFKALKGSKFLSGITAAFFKSFPGFSKATVSVIDQQAHMDEMWALIKQSGQFTPADMNRFASGLGNAADFVKSAAKKGEYILPDAAIRSLDDLAEWFARSARNGEEWIAKNAKVAKETPGSFLLRARKVDDVAKTSSILSKLPGYKFIVSKFTAKLNPAEISKLRGALNVKFLQSIQTPGQIVALAKSDAKLLLKLENEIQTAATAALRQLKRQSPARYQEALDALRNTNKIGPAGGAQQLQNLLTWQKSWDPRGYENARSAIAREATNPSTPNIFYNNFMNGEWQSLQTYGFSKDYWAKAGTSIPNIDLMNRRFLDYVPILWNEVQDMGEDIKSELGIESPDDINGLFWPLLKSASDAAEYIGVPGVEWTKEKAKAAGKTVASIFKLHPAAAMTGFVDDPTAGMTYDPGKKFVIHPDDSPVIKKKERDKETRINKSRSWF